MTTGIYAIVAPSGKRYVGQAQHIEDRFEKHRRNLQRGTHDCVALQHAWNTSRPKRLAAWQWVILCAIPIHDQLNNPLDMGSLEIYYINNSEFGVFNTIGVMEDPDV